MNIAPCNPYHAKRVGTETVVTSDGKSTFKVYYLDIAGRENRSRYEWAHADIDRNGFSARFRSAGFEGVGFVTAFPHITKVFRFAPQVETVLHVTAFATPSFEPIDLDRGEGYVEFACLAEALVAADEYRFWAEADSVTSYLADWSDFADGPIRSSDKLSRFWTAE